MSTEKDPHGKDQHEPGAKMDANKPRMGLVLLGFSRALVEVCEVGTAGAAEYSDSGWEQVPNGVERYTDAMLRHALGVGDEIVSHEAQTAWNALARLELLLRQREVNHRWEAEKVGCRS